MMKITEEDWQTFATKAIMYVGFPMATTYSIPLHKFPFGAYEEDDHKFCCLVIDKDHKWAFHFIRNFRQNYLIPSDRSLMVFKGVLKEKYGDDKWKPIDSFKYEFMFDGNDITFEREIPSDLHKVQESYLRKMGRL